MKKKQISILDGLLRKFNDMNENRDDAVVGLSYTTCGICGRKYIKPPGSIYKISLCGKVINCCSYHCYNIALARKENKNV